MTNVVKFPPTPDDLDKYIGPARYGSDVFCDGHVVPNMWIVDNGPDVGTVEICFPGPVHHIFPRDLAAAAIQLAAKAMAIGAGHSHVSSTHATTKPYGAMVIELGSPSDLGADQ